MSVCVLPVLCFPVFNVIHSTDLTIKTFWGAVAEAVTVVKDHVKAKLEDAWVGLQPSAEAAALEDFDRDITKEVLRQQRIKLEHTCEWLQNHVFSRFQQFFNQDEHGVPRQWQNMSSDQIKEVYVEARKKALG